MYFMLNNHCVYNINVIYDLFNNIQYELNEVNIKILNDFLNKKDTRYVEKKYNKEKLSEFSDLFIKNNLGMYFDTIAASKPITTLGPQKLELYSLVPFSLDQAVIEITGDCNLNCIFCSEDNMVYRACGCKKWAYEKTISDKKWFDIAEQIKLLNPNTVVFSGGEPLLKRELLIELIEYFSNSGIKSIIYTNGFLLDNDLLEFFSAKQVMLIVQIYSKYEKIYNKITNTDINIEKLKDSLSNWISMKGGLFFNLLVCDENQEEVSELENYLKKVKIPYQRALLFPKNKHYSKKYFNEIIKPSNRRNIVTFENYNHSCYFNTCLVNNIFVAANGEVYPCMMLRDFKIGDLKVENLCDVFRKDKHKEFWELSKKKVNKCKDCGFNVGCQDCRAIEYYVDKNIYDMNYCSRLIK